jgi:hypothetical protein
LQLIELGLKPIVIERGEVRGRRRDLKAINVDHLVNEDSNYCFGEGGEVLTPMGNCILGQKRGM